MKNGLWITSDYGKRFIGNPKQPTISVYSLADGEYQVSQFRGDDCVRSPTFPEFNVTPEEIFQFGEVSE